MKKIKVLTSLVGLTGLSMGLVPMMASCNCHGTNVELSEDVTKLGVTVKSSHIVKGEDSTITFGLPEHKLLKSAEVTVGNETVLPAQMSVDSPTLTIKAAAMIEDKVIVKGVDLADDFKITFGTGSASGVSVASSDLKLNTKSTITLTLPQGKEIQSVTAKIDSKSKTVTFAQNVITIQAADMVGYNIELVVALQDIIVVTDTLKYNDVETTVGHFVPEGQHEANTPYVFMADTSLIPNGGRIIRIGNASFSGAVLYENSVKVFYEKNGVRKQLVKGTSGQSGSDWDYWVGSTAEDGIQFNDNSTTLSNLEHGDKFYFSFTCSGAIPGGNPFFYVYVDYQ